MSRHSRRHSPRLRWLRWVLFGVVPILTFVLVASTVTALAAFHKVNTGLHLLETGRQHLLSNPQQAARDFTAAGQAEAEASQLLQQAPLYVKLTMPIPPFRWEINLMKGSYALSQSGIVASQLASQFPAFDKNESDINTLLLQTSTTFFTWYNDHVADLNQLRFNLTEANDQLHTIPVWALGSKKAEFVHIQTILSTASNLIPQLMDTADSLQQALGGQPYPDATPHTFLIAFQNNAELRPSGGFIGSFGTLTASGGYLRSFTFGTNIYKLDNPFTSSHPQTPPDILQTTTTAWAFRDSNIGAGFLPEISTQVQHFYEVESGQTIQGIIYIDSSLLEDILKITGAVTLPGTSTVVTSDTVSSTLTQEVEKNYFVSDANKLANEPKAVLGDLIPVLLQKVTHLAHPLDQLGPTLQKAVLRKSIQAWFVDSTLEEQVASLLPDDTPPQRGNWLKIVNTNIGGLKSSRNVHQTVTITPQVVPSEDKIEFTVEITRTHTGTGAWPDSDNNNYMDVYLPANAYVSELPQGIGGKSLLNADQQALLGTTNKQWQTVVERTSGSTAWQRVGFWATTLPGQTTHYQLRYSLSLNDASTHHLLYLKEAGSEHETVIIGKKDTSVDQNLNLIF